MLSHPKGWDSVQYSDLLNLILLYPLESGHVIPYMASQGSVYIILSDFLIVALTFYDHFKTHLQVFGYLI